MSEPASTLDPDGRSYVPLAVAGGGAAAVVLGWILGSRLLRAVGLLAGGAGVALYARERLAERSAKIDAAEERVRSELDDLDPVARAQVLADLARSAL